jgi:hypothetical protein
MSFEPYDPKATRVYKQGITAQKVIAAFKHFGSLRMAGKVCGISKETVKRILKEHEVALTPKAIPPEKVNYDPTKPYSPLAKWLKEHSDDKDFPRSFKIIAERSGATRDSVKCYFYRRRKEAAKLLRKLPDLRKVSVELVDLEEKPFLTTSLSSYTYSIDRFASCAVLTGKFAASDKAMVAAVIPSIETFAKRVLKIGKEKR